MVEVLLVAFAQAVESRLSVAIIQVPPAWTFTVAGKEPAALSALQWQRIALGTPEGLLLWRVKQLEQGWGLVVSFGSTELSQPVARIDEMVAGVDAAICLDDSSVATGGSHGAYAWNGTHPCGQSGVEELYENASHVTAHPLVEDLAEEPSPCVGVNVMVCVLFDNRRKLQVAAPDAAEEFVKFDGMGCIDRVDGSHRVPLDLVAFEEVDGVHHLFPCRLAVPCRSAGVVQVLRAVDADAHEPSLVMQEAAPLRCEQRAVGLQGVVDVVSVGVLLLEAYGTAVEVQPGQHRFAAMPREEHVWRSLHFDILPDKSFEQFVGHVVCIALAPIIAIATCEVAGVADGLSHDVDGVRKGAKHRLQTLTTNLLENSLKAMQS